MTLVRLHYFSHQGDMGRHWRRRTTLYRTYMLSKAWFAWSRFGKPGESMQFLGITGTDGKSTTSAMLYHLMKEAGVKVGIISTVYIDAGNGLEDNESHMTSVDHKMFWQLIQQAESSGYTHMVIEVSSHALFQYRTRPLKFDGVGCTNISREHLDFHGTLEHYAASKAELFARTTKNALGVLPVDFSYTSLFAHQGLPLKMFGYTDDASIWVDTIAQSGALSFAMHIGDTILQISTKIVGAFNAENMMVAALLAQHTGVTLDDIHTGLMSFTGLPGRQELIQTKQGITAMIDFAVTPDGLQTLYTAIRQMGYTKIIAVFGATGNRDQGKRPKMGAIASQLCDIVIITEDENYHEDGLVIMKQVAAGIPGSSSTYELVQDRTEAIYRGLELAESGDIVVVTGMANYSSRAMNTGNLPWNEKEVIQDQMETLGLTLV